MREFQFSTCEVTEKCKDEGYYHEGPRRPGFSVMPEVRCRPVHSFKNSEANLWIHSYDVLLPTETMTTDFMCDLRAGAAVSLSFLFFPFRVSFTFAP